MKYPHLPTKSLGKCCPNLCERAHGWPLLEKSRNDVRENTVWASGRWVEAGGGRGGTWKSVLSATHLGVSLARSRAEALNKRTGLTLVGGRQCPKRVPENRTPKFDRAAQWWPAQMMGKEGKFPLYLDSPPSLCHLHKWS